MPIDVGVRICEQRQRRSNRFIIRGFILQRMFGNQLHKLRSLRVMKDTIRIGTRGSQLALWQANWIKTRITQLDPAVNVELNIIKTKGDKILDVPLADVGGKGLFVKEIETALLDHQVDLAVHSMKDMPADLPAGLCLGPVPRRENPSDVLISKDNLSFIDLPDQARIGTSSLRRSAQLLHARHDLHIVPLRGNLDTRLKKLQSGSDAMDAIVLAAAGVIRLGLEKVVTEYLNHSVMLPAVGQGALCIELRKDDRHTADLLAGLNHPASRTAVLAERSFLNRLEGGCQVPIAAQASVRGEHIHLEGLVADIDGTNVIREAIKGPQKQCENLGIALAERLLLKGADQLLEKLKANA